MGAKGEKEIFMFEKIPGPEEIMNQELSNEAASFRTKAIEELNRRASHSSHRMEQVSQLFESSGNYYRDAGNPQQAMIEHAVAGLQTASNERQQQFLHSISKMGMKNQLAKYSDALMGILRKGETFHGSPGYLFIRAEHLSSELRKLENQGGDSQKIDELKKSIEDHYYKAGLGKGFGQYK